MKYLPLVWSGLRRKPTRSVLTVCSIAVAFLLLGLLKGMSMGLEWLTMQASESLLRVSNRVLSEYRLPVGYHQQIQKIEGVAAITYSDGMGAYFRDQAQSFGVAAIGTTDYFAFAPQIEVSKADLEAFGELRTGAIVGRSLAEDYGWHIGDQVPIISSVPKKDGTKSWSIDIVGIWDMKRTEKGEETSKAATRLVFIHYAYLDEGRAGLNGTVGSFRIKAAPPEQAAVIAKRIDDQFINSAVPTRTVSDREQIRTNIHRMGDYEFFINAIVGSALFTILIVTGGTMMQSISERVPEFAVLKSMGYQNRLIVFITLLESLTMCLIGAALGLAVALMISPAAFAKVAMPPVAIPLSTYLLGIVIAVVMAIACALPPVYRLNRISVVDGLAGR